MKKVLKFVLAAFAAVFLLSLFFSDGTDVAAGDAVEQAAAEPEAEEAAPLEIVKHNLTYESSIGAHTIHCRVKNNTGNLYTYLDITATFYDKDGNIVGTGMGNATNLAGGATKTVDVMAMGVENADSYDVAIDNMVVHGQF